MTHLNKVIFAIDNDTDLHQVAKFMRYMDTAKAMGDLRGSFIIGTGCYNNKIETCYIVDERDFKDVIIKSNYTDHQECILVVPADTRQPCTLVGHGWSDTINPMKEVSQKEAFKSDNWTYVHESNRYYTTEVL